MSIERIDLDLSQSLGTEDEMETILNSLRERGLYDRNLLYSAFNGCEIDKVLSTGCYTRKMRKHIKGLFCCREEEFTNSAETPLEYLNDFDERALAVYKGELLEQALDNNEYLFKGDPLDALVAVLKLQY